MQDLALEFGTPVNTLARAIPEREFISWQRYAARRMLPQRRMEMYLAQIAYLIAATMGGVTGKSLQDYMFDPSDETENEELTVDDVAEFFGATIVSKGK